MKACAISDLHGFLPSVKPCDLLLICGDIMPLDIQTNMPLSLNWLATVFKDWMESLPVDHVVMIAGNHDFVFERSEGWAKIALNCGKITYLKNESFTYTSNDGEQITIFGTPYCKIFGNWAFMREPEYLIEKYSEIPERVDILISHDAPKIGGVGKINEGRWYGEDAGNPYLAEAIRLKKPKYVFCGHIHSGEHGLTELDDTKLHNVSIMNEHYAPLNAPLDVDI